MQFLTPVPCTTGKTGRAKGRKAVCQYKSSSIYEEEVCVNK